MEENIVKTKRHLNLPVKFFLFIIFSALYILPLILGLWAESIMADVSFQFNLGYEHGIGGMLAVFAFVGVILLGLTGLIITENIFYKKTDISDFFFVLSPLVAVVFAVADFAYLLDTNGSYYANDNGILILYLMTLGVIKAVADGIRLLKNKSFRFLPLCLISLVFCFSCAPLCQCYEEFIYQKAIGEKDRTSSWNSINQMVNRDEAWQKIVTDTEFTSVKLQKV